jgi:rubrerythrin
MDWNTPQGILRRGMNVERDGYRFYMQAAERASNERGQAMFRDLAEQEEDHLRLLLAEYRALEAGEGWLPYEEAMAQEFVLDPANPTLPGEEPPEDDMPVFTPEREISLESDIAALDFGLETERIARELYAQGAEETDDEHAQQAYSFLVKQEEQHYQLLENTRDYLSENNTWWDSEEYPFFIG